MGSKLVRHHFAWRTVCPSAACASGAWLQTFEGRLIDTKSITTAKFIRHFGRHHDKARRVSITLPSMVGNLPSFRRYSSLHDGETKSGNVRIRPIMGWQLRPPVSVVVPPVIIAAKRTGYPVVHLRIRIMRLSPFGRKEEQVGIFVPVIPHDLSWKRT